ncbi:MAG: hypothetical protein AAF518_13175 [Spirochaetota bacterium]
MFRKKFKLTKSKIVLELPVELLGKEVELRVEEVQPSLEGKTKKNDAILKYLEKPFVMDGFSFIDRETIYDI